MFQPVGRLGQSQFVSWPNHGQEPGSGVTAQWYGDYGTVGVLIVHSLLCLPVMGAERRALYFVILPKGCFLLNDQTAMITLPW
jgi:hypothetical protein